MSETTVKSPVQLSAKEKVGGGGNQVKKPRNAIDSLETSIINCVTTHFKAAYGTYIGGGKNKEEKEVSVSGTASAVLASIVNKFARVILDKAIQYTSLANKKMLSVDAIKIAARTCTPASISSTAATAWAKIFSGKKQWEILEGWTDTIKSLRAASSGSSESMTTRINDILCANGQHIKPTVMRRLIAQIASKNIRLGGEQPGIALSIVCGAVIEIIARSIRQDHEGMGKEGFIVAPKHIIRVIQANEVLRHIFGTINMVGAPVGLLDHTVRRKRRRSTRGAMVEVEGSPAPKRRRVLVAPMSPPPSEGSEPPSPMMMPLSPMTPSPMSSPPSSPPPPPRRRKSQKKKKSAKKKASKSAR